MAKHVKEDKKGEELEKSPNRAHIPFISGSISPSTLRINTLDPLSGPSTTHFLDFNTIPQNHYLSPQRYKRNIEKEEEPNKYPKYK